eukprot:COSAG06_NODE_46265_length_348_cov_0.767068_1_plen_49_part_10
MFQARGQAPSRENTGLEPTQNLLVVAGAAQTSCLLPRHVNRWSPSPSRR